MIIDIRTAKYYLSCGILKKWHDKTFDDFKNDEVALKEIKKYLEKVEEYRLGGFGLYLHGENGVGKTLLLNCVFKELIEKRYKVCIVNFGDLITSFTNGWYDNNEQNKMRELKSCHFLGIEEIGKEFKSKEGQLAKTVFDNVIRHRVQMNKPTWITSNIHPLELKTIYSPDIASLMTEAFLDLKVNGKDYREVIRREWINK